MHLLLTVLHIFLWYKLEEFALKSSHLTFDDHFRYSHDLYVSSISDIMRRN